MRRALVVDDHPDNTYLLKVLLEGAGWEVEVARHGAEALLLAHQRPPALVVSDLLMPVMDGFTLLRHWKADPRLQQVPFIVYTATYTEEGDERLALDMGADGFILKPSEPDDFLARIDEVMARGATAVGATRPRVGSETASLELYSSTLIRKLEEKMLQLEQSHRILEHEQAELRLRDRAIQAVSQGVVLADARLPDAPITFANQGFSQMTGYGLDEVLGRNCRFLQGPDTDAEVIASLRAAVREARPIATEILNHRKDGTPFWCRLTLSPVTDASGAVTHFVGVQEDVTERRALEAQLRQGQKMEAVGRLAGGVAHDFNNLLSVILTYAHLITLDVPADSPLLPDLQEIRRAGARAADLTHQLLAFSRQQVLQPRVLDLRDAVRAMEKMLRRLLGEDIALTLDLSPYPCHVRADPTQVEQIVLNLVVNARDAMPGGGELRLEAGAVEIDDATAASLDGLSAGPYVMLAVTDDGVGMDAATRERVFEPFFTTKAPGRGTGLGLATVFGIVRQSQGRTVVESELGRGTTFRVYLPRTDEDVPRLSAAAPPPDTFQGTETILVVEDDEQVRTMVRSVLSRYGYAVLDAQNGGEAFLVAEQFTGPIDLLMTDVVMPRMSGPQLARRLVAMRPRMQVLYTSGYTEDAIIHRGVTDAGIQFLPKPILPEALLSAVRTALDARE